jgi:PHD/YefM family antitoxin component YafN of YafNO toxin-antitoxin module
MPVVITEQGTAVGVIMSPSAYTHLRRIEAYFEILRLSHSLQESGITARELFRLSREEAEVR